MERKMEEKNLSFDQLSEKYNAKTSGFSKLLLILMVPMFAAVFFLFNVRKQKFFADHLLASLEYMCYILFYNTIILSFLLLAIAYLCQLMGVDITPAFSNEWYLLMPIIATSLVYFNFCMQRTFYSDKMIIAAIKAAILLFMTMPVLYAYRFILFHFTMWRI
jgi:hypothetical protein